MIISLDDLQQHFEETARHAANSLGGSYSNPIEFIAFLLHSELQLQRFIHSFDSSHVLLFKGHIYSNNGFYRNGIKNLILDGATTRFYALDRVGRFTGNLTDL